MSTVPCCFATSRMRVMVGPSSGSAVAYHFGSCSAGKYGPWKISCRHVTWAPSAAAFPISSTCLSIASSFGMFALHWISAARTVAMGSPSLSECRDDVLPEGADHALGVVDHRVDVELGHTQSLELLQLRDTRVRRAEDAEALDHLVGDEAGVLGAGPAVVGVVVVVARPDVVGQLLRQ